MRNDNLINFKKAIVLKRLLKDGSIIKRKIGEDSKNCEEIELKNVELYEPVSFNQLVNLNKKKYRNSKILSLKNHFWNSLWSLEKSIEIYKELINRTEFWERKSTYDFNFTDWNKLKKANGKLTRYYNDIREIYKKIESEEI